jgi:hypothetical protein
VAEPDTDFTIKINGAAAYTMSTTEERYDVVPDAEACALSITTVELLDPLGNSVVAP